MIESVFGEGEESNGAALTFLSSSASGGEGGGTRDEPSSPSSPDEKVRFRFFLGLIIEIGALTGGKTSGSHLLNILAPDRCRWEINPSIDQSPNHGFVLWLHRLKEMKNPEIIKSKVNIKGEERWEHVRERRWKRGKEKERKARKVEQKKKKRKEKAGERSGDRKER